MYLLLFLWQQHKQLKERSTCLAHGFKLRSLMATGAEAAGNPAFVRNAASTLRMQKVPNAGAQLIVSFLLMDLSPWDSATLYSK